MPRFHINLFNDTDIIDEDGQDYTDLDAAEAETVRAARDIIAEHVRSGQSVDLNHRMEITDADHELLRVVRFADVVSIRR